LQVIIKLSPIHESRRKLEFDLKTEKYVNAIHSSSFPTEVTGNPGGFVIVGERA
jgi:hypothetical protein